MNRPEYAAAHSRGGIMDRVHAKELTVNGQIPLLCEHRLDPEGERGLSITTGREQDEIRAALRTGLHPIYLLLSVTERAVGRKRLDKKWIGHYRYNVTIFLLQDYCNNMTEVKQIMKFGDAGGKCVVTENKGKCNEDKKGVNPKKNDYLPFC